MDQISERRSFDERLRTKNLTLSLMDFLRDVGLSRDEGFHGDDCTELSELIDGR